MGIVASLFLIAVGGIMRFAVTIQGHGFNIHTAGAVLMIIGVLGAILSIAFWASWGGFGHTRRTYRRSTVVAAQPAIVYTQPPRPSTANPPRPCLANPPRKPCIGKSADSLAIVPPRGTRSRSESAAWAAAVRRWGQRGTVRDAPRPTRGLLLRRRIQWRMCRHRVLEPRDVATAGSGGDADGVMLELVVACELQPAAVSSATMCSMLSTYHVAIVAADWPAVMA